MTVGIFIGVYVFLNSTLYNVTRRRTLGSQLG